MTTQTLTWHDPTTRTDASPIAPDTFVIRVFDSMTPNVPVDTVAQGVQSWPIPANLPPGTHSYTLVAAITSGSGGTSVPSSPPASLTVGDAPPAAPPNPPTNVTINSSQPPPTGSGFVLAEGDSITANPGSYAALYASANPGVILINNAVIGSVLNDVINRRVAAIATIAAHPGKGPYIYTLLIGANESGTIAADVNGYVAKIAAHLDALKAGGFNRVVVQTTTSGGIPEPTRLQYDNALFGLVPAHADAVVNYRNCIMGWDGSNNLVPSHFADSIHPASGGYVVMKPLYEKVLNSFIAGIVPAPIPNPGPPTYPSPRPNTLDNLTASPGPQLTFSNNNCTVATNDSTGAGGLVRTMLGKSTGKWAAEFQISGLGPFHQIFGFCDDGNFKVGFPITATVQGMPFELGTMANTAGQSVWGSYGNIMGFGNAGGGNGLDGLATGDRVTFVWDADAKVAWIGRNGKFGGSNDPAHGVGGWVNWTSPYTIFPMIQLRASTDAVIYLTSGQLYIPSGFSPLA
jgi:hypothetical protein